MPSSLRLLRKKEVLARIGVHPVTLWAWTRAGNFPQPVVLNPNCKNSPVAWREEDVNAWIASRPHGKGGDGPMIRHLARKRAAEAEAAEQPVVRRRLLRFPVDA